MQAADAAAALNSSAATLERLLGFTPGELQLPEAPRLPNVDEALAAVRKRPDIEAGRLSVSQAQHNLWSFEGQRFWPRVDLQAEFFYVYPSFTPVNWRTFALLTIPLFSTGAEHVQVEAQRVVLRNAEDALRRDELAAEEQVKTVYAQLSAAALRRDLASAQIADAQENFALVRQQFRLGAVTFLEVTNAQAVLTEAESQRVVADFGHHLAVYQLLAAAGLLSL
jgi:outer membrane protein TolC